MEVAGGRETPRGGPAHFECPEDFSESPFPPGLPFSREALQGPSKQLFLIRAPADFRPESLDGYVVPLLGSQTLKVPHPNGPQKVYTLQTSPGDLGSARLLVPSDHQNPLTCAPPFSSSLSICERYGDPDGSQPLFPLAARRAPQIPEGLKQRFLPFGSHLESPPPPRESAEQPPRKKKKKKRQLQAVGYMGDPEEPPKCEPWLGAAPEMPAEEATVAGEAGSFREGGKSRKHRKHRRQAAEEETGRELGVSGAVAQLPEPPSSLEGPSRGSLLVGEVEDLGGRRKKKKKQKKEAAAAAVEEEALLLDPSSLAQQSELEARLQGGPEACTGENGISPAEEELGRRKHKKKRKRAEAEGVTSMGLSSIKEEALGGISGAGSTPEGSLVRAKEEPGVSASSSRATEEEKVVLQQAGSVWVEPNSVKREEDGGHRNELGEMPSQKHKKKKKKHKHKHKREAAEKLPAGTAE